LSKDRPREHRGRLGHQRDAAADLARGERPHVDAVEQHLPLVRLGEEAEDPQQGRLPATRRATEGVDRAARDAEVDAVEQHSALVRLPEATGFEQGGHAAEHRT
jgi:hypothetical protein